MQTVSVEKYIEGVNSIYIEQPTYALGHDGSDGQCDCIGMCRGGLKRAGATDIKNMGGTNNAARNAIKNLAQIKSEKQLRLGDVVLKTRDKDDSNMPLPDNYRKGSSGYNANVGETNFVHIGTVTQINPLRITHMTSPTAMIDTKLGKWSWYGQLPWVDYNAEHENGSDPLFSTVYAESGKTVKMRQKPSTLCRLYWDVPIGSEVVDLGSDGTWSEIVWNGRTGYMMTKYLIHSNSATYIVVIPNLTSEQADEIVAKYAGAYKEMGKG